MIWTQVKAKLQAAAASIRKKKLLDVATESLLKEIPVVGGFLGTYWSKTGGGADDAEQMADFIEVIASQEQAFDKLSALVEAQGDQLVAQGESLGEILLQVGQIGDIGDDVKDIKEQLGRFLRTLGVKSARDAFESAAAMHHDHAESAAQIKQAEDLLGEEASAEDFHALGILYLTTGRDTTAEACLLEVVDRKPDFAPALLGLGMIYQRRATDRLREQNYGLVEDAVLKAEGYVKAALHHDPSDMGLQIELGYLQKDMAYRYQAVGQPLKSTAAIEKAETYFQNAIKINPNDASADNGMGSLALVRHDYDAAIDWCTRATKLAPDYLFAWFDLAQAYYVKAKAIEEDLPRVEYLQPGLRAYQKVVELDGAADALPPHAREAIDGMYGHVLQMFEQLPAASRQQL